MDHSNPFQEFNDSLRELRKAVRELHLSTIQVRDAMGKAINDSNLRGTISLLANDIALRRSLEEVIK